MAETRAWSLAVRGITAQADMAQAVRTFVETVDRTVADEQRAPQTQPPPRKVGCSSDVPERCMRDFVTTPPTQRRVAGGLV